MSNPEHKIGFFNQSVILILLLLTFGNLFAQPERESSDFSYALKLYNQKFYDLSIQQFEKFYNLYPNSARAADAHYYAGMAYFQLGKFDRAQREFQTLALGYPKSERAAEAWFQAGQSAERAGDFDAAIKAYESIKLLYPNSPFASRGMYAAGLVYIRKKDFNKAEALFGQLLDRYPASPKYFNAMVKRAFCFYALNDYQKAQTAIKKVLAGQPDREVRLEAMLISGQIAAAQGKVEQALQTLQNVLREGKGTPVFDRALPELSGLLIRKGEHKQAAQLLEKNADAVKDDRVRLRVREQMGDLYYLQNQFGLAEKEYRQLLKNSPSDSLSLLYGFKLALCLRRQQLTDRAVEKAAELLQRFGRNKGYLASLARRQYLAWLDAANRTGEAISFIYKQLESAADLPFDQKVELSLRLSGFLQKSGRWMEIVHLLKPLALKPEVFAGKDEAVFRLARAYEELKDFKQSLRLYRQITTEFAASPYYSEARDRIDDLISLKIINMERAVSHQAQLLGELLENKQPSRLKFQLAKIYLEDLKKFDQAEQQLKAAMADSSDFQGDLHLFLGKLYLTLSRKRDLSEDRARGYLQQASEQFKVALTDSATCSAPDEAAWLLVKTALSLEQVDVAKEQRLLESLLTKYPDSRFREEWLHTLALDLAFDSTTVDVSKQYFKDLVENYAASPHISSYLYDYGKLLKNEDKTRAVELFKQIALRYPYAPETFRALEEVADFYRGNGEYDAAFQIYTRLLKSYSYLKDLDEVRQKLTMLSIRTGAYQQALKRLKTELPRVLLSDLVLGHEFLPGDVTEQIYLLARAYEGNGNIRMAMRYYQLYLQRAPQGSRKDDAHFRLGDLFFKAGQTEIALEHFRQIPAENRELYLPAKNYAAKIYFDQKDYSRAAAEYKQLIGLMTDPAAQSEVQQKYIISLIRNGQLKESAKAIKNFKKKFPDHKNALAAFAVEIGEYHRANKNFKQAIKSFERVKKKYKSTEYVDDADYYLALTYITLNKLEDAYKILTGFYNHYPNSDLLPAALNTLGNLYYRGEKYDNAIAMFKNALQYCGDCPMRAAIMSNLIKTYTFTGFWDAAQALARKYVQEFPDAEDRIDKKIVIARAYINLNQFDNAVNYLRQIKLEADAEREPEIQFYIGEALMKAGDYENSIAEFVKIPLLSKKTKLQWEASALYYAGQCYEKLGRVSDAVRMYQEIVKRPGIDLVLKKEAKKRIKQISGRN